MKPYIKLIKNNWAPQYLCGWGSGYVVLPKDHKHYGKSCIKLSEEGIHIYGRLLYITKDTEEAWCIGFDTTNRGDSLENWSLEAVEKAALRLLTQLEA